MSFPFTAAGLGFLLGAASVSAASARHDPTPVVPQNTITLFDGVQVKNLSRFYTWLAAHRYEDPNRVFSVMDYLDGSPVVRVSGQDFGGLVSRQSFANYHLIVEYRWGAVTWKPRETRVRNSGILLHCQGEDGNYGNDFRSPWVSSIEYEIAEGITGDLLLLRGFVPGTADRLVPRLKALVNWGAYPNSLDGKPPVSDTPGRQRAPGRVGYRVWHPQGTLVAFAADAGGRVEWFKKDPEWENVLGFLGRNDFEKPLGEWNRAEVVSDGGRLVFLLNGSKVNEAADSSVTAGRLLFQSEGSEIYYRLIEVRPLGASAHETR